MTAAEEVPAAGHKISPDTFDEPFCVCADEGKADYIGQLQSIHILAGFCVQHQIRACWPVCEE